MGDHVVRAWDYECSHQEHYNDGTYHLNKIVFRGFLRNSYELRRLYQFIYNNHQFRYARVDAYYLLREFKQVSLNCSPELQDHTMCMVLTDPRYEVITSSFSLSSKEMLLMVLPVPLEMIRWKEWQGRRRFTIPGFTSEDLVRTLDLEKIAQHLLYFC